MTTSTAHRYELRIYWSQRDRVFIAEVPDLPGCMTHGDTPAQAAAEAEVAIGLWIDTAREAGLQVPKPRRDPELV
jgi:predicted RNase H-like HicB family nuclease